MSSFLLLLSSIFLLPLSLTMRVHMAAPPPSTDGWVPVVILCGINCGLSLIWSGSMSCGPTSGTSVRALPVRVGACAGLRRRGRERRPARLGEGHGEARSGQGGVVARGGVSEGVVKSRARPVVSSAPGKCARGAWIPGLRRWSARLGGGEQGEQGRARLRGTATDSAVASRARLFFVLGKARPRRGRTTMAGVRARRNRGGGSATI